MSNAKQLHHDAMDSLHQAEAALMQRDITLYKQNLRSALELETSAAFLLKDKITAEPTRSVLFRSAASLALSCGDYKKAQDLIIQALHGNPPQEIKNELLDIFSNALIEPSTIPTREVVLKRVFDIAFSLLVICLVLSWLIPVIGLLIKLGSRGPVFFKQIRTGRRNRPFYCLKFRTFALNTEGKASHVTKLGSFLRRTSIDELPQFFNVLKGEMSVVGPRPHLVRHTESYSRVINNFMVRHLVAPGITGLAQAVGRKKESRSSDQYIQNWSLLLDLKIILSSLVHAIRGYKNNYTIDSNSE
ncbi:sugar transferase [Hymenobacter radiodurans]|uniref:sugar transferase n=1 Tax=Hymenobacter radiodurans TaxID=2496028 RepID=UPI0010584DBA|nr:sugar transferase [Hymenobacter radiodurans]